ncbi:hypothetical protein [Dactylosporangium salmoneum]|uniref:Uncharacterized protein n=1 Tax=Dactylosporangium salmoneum TaxID=53361 RepID=A0ABN3FMX4_9ACTN
MVLVDDGRPRNAPARHVHNFLGQPAPAPAELLAAGRAMLAPYDIRVVTDRVERIEATGGGFLASGRGHGATVGIAVHAALLEADLAR